jgi:hypothetical protein
MKKGIIQKSEKLYGFLIRFYPKNYKQQFKAEMQFVFADLLVETYQKNGNKGIIVLWIKTIIDLVKSLITEHIDEKRGSNKMKEKTFLGPNLALLIGFLMIVPFIMLNTIIANRVEPLYSFFKISSPVDFGGNPVGVFALIISLLLILAGIGIIITPLLHKNTEGNRKFYPVNFTIASILFLGLALLLGGLAIEVYRCDILQIPNCD